MRETRSVMRTIGAEAQKISPTKIVLRAGTLKTKTRDKFCRATRRPKC
jgi:hypothetical protein